MFADTADTMASKVALQKVIAVESRALGLKATEMSYSAALQANDTTRKTILK